MAIEAPRSPDEAQIQRVLDGWTESLRTKDIDRLWSRYAPDVLLVDLAQPLRRAVAGRRDLAERFASWQGPITCELRDLEITVGHDVAFTHSLQWLRGTRTDGAETDVWLRATVRLRKIAGAWQVAH